MKNKSLTIICQRYPWPMLRGDQLAVGKMIKKLEEFTDLQVEVVYLEGGAPELSSEIFGSNIKVRKAVWSWWRFFCNILIYPLDPLQLKYFSGFYIFPESRFVYLHTIRTARSVPRRIWDGTVLAAQIDFSKEFEERALISSFPRRLIFLFEAFLIKRWQRKHFSKFQSIFRVVNSEFQDLTKSIKIETHPHGFDPERVLDSSLKKPIETVQVFTIGFWGNLTFAPNVHAAKALIAWFEYQLIDNKNFRLHIFGRNSEILSSGDPRITISGGVEDIDSEIRKLTVCVNLIAAGAGFQNKTVEAWAQGVPVIGYEAAFRGLTDIDDLKFVIESTDQITDVMKSIDFSEFSEKSTSWVKSNWNEVIFTSKKLERIVGSDE